MHGGNQVVCAMYIACHTDQIWVRLDLVEELAAKMAGVRAGQMAQMTTEIRTLVA